MKKALMFLFMLTAATSVLSLPVYAGRPATVPEPATMALLATGIGAVALFRRLRNK